MCGLCFCHAQLQQRISWEWGEMFVHKPKAPVLISNTAPCISFSEAFVAAPKSWYHFGGVNWVLLRGMGPPAVLGAAACPGSSVCPWQWACPVVPTGYGIMTDGYTTYINASTCTVSFQPTNPPIIFDLPTPQGSWSTTAHLERGKVYKLPFSNYETYIQLHVYFKIGARGGFWGNRGGFCFGVGFGVCFFFYLYIAGAKETRRKVRGCAFWKCSVHFKLIKRCEFVKWILFFNKFAIVNCYSVLKRTAKLSFNKWETLF